MTIPLLEPMLSDFKVGTIAWVIQRVIDDVQSSPTMKQFGESHFCTLRRLQSAPIGKVVAESLRKQDLIDHCKMRRKKVSAATVNQDVTYLRGVIKHASATFNDCENLTCLALEAAKPFLVKHQLIGKSHPRKRRPSDEEIANLLAYFEKQDAQKRTKIRMAPIVAFAIVSSRRRGEIVRITHGDVDYENKIYWVRDLKHPTKKKGNDKRFILWPELEEIIKRQPRRNPNDPNERIFPYDGASVGKRYIEAKRVLGIKDLRFHDCRREAISRWLRKLSPHEVRIGISGHDTIAILERNYDAVDTLELVRAKVGGIQAQTESR